MVASHIAIFQSNYKMLHFSFSKAISTVRRGVMLVGALALSVGAAWAQTDKFHFGYCSNNITPNGVGEDQVYYSAAIQITPEQATKFAGCKVDGVSVGFGSGVRKDVTIYLTYDLKGQPFLTKDGKVKVNRFNDLMFDSAYTIEAGKGFYVGYSYFCTSAISYPIGFDARTDAYDDRADNISFSLDKNTLADNWIDVGPNFGNLSLRAILSGDKLPQANAIPRSLTGTNVVGLNHPYTYTLSFANQSVKPVESLTLELTNGSRTEQRDIQLPVAVQPNEEGSVSFDFTFDNIDNNVLQVAIAKVNGMANDSGSDKMAITVTTSASVFPRVNVVEEYTGTYCGNCPRGIIGMEYMEQNYGRDNWIGIAIHNYPNDPMRCYDYEGWVNGCRITGAPMCTFNRQAPTDPSKNVLENLHLESSKISNMQVKLAVSDLNKGSKTAKLTTTITSGSKVSGFRYGIVYVVTEDNVGPYNQTNNYGPSLPPLEGYPTTGTVSQIYNHVARYVSAWGGEYDALPRQVEAGVEYTHSHSAQFAAVGNVDEANFIVMLVDSEDHTIVNADKVSVKHGGLSATGIESVSADADDAVAVYGHSLVYTGNGSAAVYTVSGAKCAQLDGGNSVELTPGLYIVAMPGVTRKVMVH